MYTPGPFGVGVHRAPHLRRYRALEVHKRRFFLIGHFETG